MPIEHHQSIADVEYRWPVDPSAAAKAAGWVKRTPDRLVADLEGMATYFPHWLLVGSQDGAPSHCLRCAAPHVPTRGSIQCVVCGGRVQVNGLLWLGHIPVLARPEPSFVARQAALRAAGFGEASTPQGTYLLVPLSLLYPQEWPNVEPVVRYAGRWLDLMGLPRASAAHHLIQNGRACIFAWEQWVAMTVAEVLQQRMLNHVVSLFKIVAGQSPAQAFVGRIHHDAWHPER